MHEPEQHVPLLPPHVWPMFFVQPDGGATVAHTENPISVAQHVAGLQHSALAVHCVPIALQDDPLHRRMPASSAVQGAKPQHSLCMLHTPLSGMQQAGFVAS